VTLTVQPAANTTMGKSGIKILLLVNASRNASQGHLQITSNEQHMRNIRGELFRYLDVKRHLWNAYFINIVRDPGKCEPLDSFESIDRQLFYALVCHPLGIDFDPSLRESGRTGRILVRPRPTVHNIQVWIASTPRRWEQQEITTHGLTLTYIEFFQWDSFDFLTLPLVRCKIREFLAQPEYVGKEALVGHDLVDFWLAN
jgi:hypothetical protein